MSRLHLVVSAAGDGAVEVEDLDGARHSVSLLALDGPPPVEGEWLVVHSGYAIDRVDAAEAERIAAEVQSALARSAAAGNPSTFPPRPRDLDGGASP